MTDPDGQNGSDATAGSTMPSEAMGGALSEGPPTVVHRHHWIVRVTHWVNALALLVMIGSGLRIFNAFPGFAPKGKDRKSTRLNSSHRH